MKINSVQIKQTNAGLLIKGKEVLFDALRQYSYMDIEGNGRSHNSQLFNANRERFRFSVLPQIEDSLRGIGLFLNDFTEREVGFPPVNKTTVYVKSLQEGADIDDPNSMFLLMLYHSPGSIGHRAEEPLAAELGLEQQLLDLEVDVDVLAVDGHFEIDLEKLIRMLDGVDGLDVQRISGDFLAGHYASVQPFSYYWLLDRGEFNVSMRLSHVGGGSLPRRGPWVSRGPVIKGPLFEGFWDGITGVHTPRVEFLIKRDFWKPIIDQPVKAEVTNLASKISAEISVCSGV